MTSDVEPDSFFRPMLVETRRDEIMHRIETFKLWRDVDMASAREWRAMGCPGFDTRDDVRRNVRYARLWHHEYLKLVRRSKLQ